MRWEAKQAWRAGATVLVLVALAAGCSLVTSYDGYVREGPAAKTIPDRPNIPTTRGGTNLVGATSSLRFLDQPDASVLGYDLDETCTTADLATRPCTNGKAIDQTDLQGRCIDNAAGAILSGLYPPAANARLQDALRHGRFGLLLDVADWDGTANDSAVKVVFLNVVGLEGDQDGGGGATYKGSDRFVIDRDSFFNEEELVPTYSTTKAYVVDGMLVAPIDAFSFRIEVPNAQGTASVVSIPLSKATLIGRIQRDGTAGLRMNDAQLVGRLAVADVFKQISGIGLCRSSPNYQGIKAQTCAALDLPLDPNARRSATCDALSFAMGFSIGPALRGGVGSSPGVPSICGEEPADTCK